jgi:hypothetical protein
MEYSELQKKGFEIAKRHETLPLADRLGIIARTFGCETARISTRPCTGKWRGTSDVSIIFDNGNALFIGNRLTPKAKQKGVVNELVNATLAQYNPEIVREAKERGSAALHIREAEDNAVAARMGLKPYTFLNVELNDGMDARSGGYLGWYCVTLAVEDNIFGFIETGLNYDIARGVLSERVSRPEYFVAGGMRDNEADFVFNNVGHSSFNGTHQISLPAGARERAEKALSDRVLGIGGELIASRHPNLAQRLNLLSASQERPSVMDRLAAAKGAVAKNDADRPSPDKTKYKSHGAEH